jgi:UDP-N-acetylmuramyl tripeptide synthase
MKMRRLAAVWAGKLVKIICKVTGKRGETLPGQIAIKIYPNILRDLSMQVNKDIFVVCGTNGKTTTNNLLADTLSAKNQRVICNRSGSNMLNGIVAAFIDGSSWTGHIRADYACIEIDEASTVKVFPHFTPDFMVITNLFRDQLDRYGEIDITMNLLQKAIEMAPDLKLIVNGDDSLITSLAIKSKREVVYFGVSERVNTDSLENEIREGSFCPECGKKLIYEFYHYSQLGTYHCDFCDFKRPYIKYDASHIELKDGISFKVDDFQIKTNYRGFYNIYNILAVYAVGISAGFSLNNFNKVLEQYNPQNGRMETFIIKGCRVLLNLAKNPAGFNQNISAVIEDENPKDVIIVINDNAQDGRDISWLWDVDFERLAKANVNNILVSGIRSLDMALRLKYVDIESTLEKNVEDAIRKCIKQGKNNLYVLVNYTALYDTHLILKKMEKEKK